MAAFYTGEGAEEVVENLSEISQTLIHRHEEYAETFFTLTLILGGTALVTLIAEIKKFRYTKHLMVLVLLVAISDGVFAAYTGASGGEIRHTEIRNDPKIIEVAPAEKIER
jgi:DMSO reductase anchor subunit